MVTCVRGGPVAVIARGAAPPGTSIADLQDETSADGSHEAIVRFLVGDNEGAREMLASWAGLVGYRRIWFPGEVVSLEGAGADACVEMETACAACGVTHRDGGADFWSYVFRQRRFPANCMVCGCTIPQWRRSSTGLNPSESLAPVELEETAGIMVAADSSTKGKR